MPKLFEWSKHKWRKTAARRRLGAARGKVFLIHGRDLQSVDLILNSLDDLGIAAIRWEDAIALTGSGTPYVLDVVRAGMSAADVAIALFTPDEDVSLKPELRKVGEHDVEGRQPRPNVWLEAGMALAMDRTRVILIEVGTCRAASDLHGLHFLRVDGDTDYGEFISLLENRLHASGCKTGR